VKGWKGRQIRGNLKTNISLTYYPTPPYIFPTYFYFSSSLVPFYPAISDPPHLSLPPPLFLHSPVPRSYITFAPPFPPTNSPFSFPPHFFHPLYPQSFF